MIKLKRLKILKYRNVKPGTELHFDDGVNLILGQNASGKTTLLALVSALLRGDFAALHETEYDVEVDVSIDDVITTLVVSHHPSPTSGSGLTRAGAWPEGSIKSSVPEPSRIIPAGWFLFDLNAHNSGAASSAYRFDESLGAFAATTGRILELAGPAVPPTATAERREFDEGEVWLNEDYIALDMLPRLSRGDAADPIFRRPLNLTDFELLQEFAVATGFGDITLKPNFHERRLWGGEVHFKLNGFTFELTRPDGTIIHHDRLSYGQKRLLAFYYYLACNPSIVIADELVNGLHHRWIESCMKALGDRQAFLTSQNPLLFDYVEFDSVEQVRSRFITCRLEQADGREWMVWENMSEDDAARFFDAYQAGIEHVGDILITRGMW